jgi:hypothetical protein
MKKIVLALSIIGMFLVVSDLYAANVPVPKKLDKKAEVVMPNITKKQLLDALTNEMMSRDFMVKSTTDYNIVYSKIDDNQRDWVMFGPNPESRISYDVVETANGIKIVATQEMVSNPNTAKEFKYDFSYYENVVEFQKALLTKVKESIDFAGIK